MDTDLHTIKFNLTMKNVVGCVQDSPLRTDGNKVLVLYLKDNEKEIYTETAKHLGTADTMDTMLCNGLPFYSVQLNVYTIIDGDTDFLISESIKRIFPNIHAKTMRDLGHHDLLYLTVDLEIVAAKLGFNINDYHIYSIYPKVNYSYPITYFDNEQI